MVDSLADFAASTVAVAPSPTTSGSTLVVQTGEGAYFPTPPFDVTMAPPGVKSTWLNAEIGRCTNVTGDTLTITRHQYGTTAQPVDVGWVIENNITKNLLMQILATVNSTVRWVDLGLVDLVSAVMNGPQTLYDMPEGSFLASIRFTDDPDSVMSDFANLPPSFVASLYMWPAFGTVKSFGWAAFAGIKSPASGLSYDTLFLAAQNGGYGPFAALDAGATDFNASVLSAATVGPIEAALLVSEAGGNVTGTSWRAAPIVAWEADTSYDGSQDNTVATPGALKKAIILANGTLWVNEESGPALSGSSEPDFAGNAGGSVGDGALTPAFLYGDEPLSLPLTIVSSVNDTFVYTGTGGAGSPETFTVAPGVYSTTSEAIAAFAAAIGAAHGEAFSTLATVTLFSDDYQALTLTMVAPGPSQNGNTITEGNGGAAAFGLTGNPDTFADGGQAIEWLDTTSPPPTVGAVHVVAEIVTPAAP